jgi:TonB family protein
MNMPTLFRMAATRVAAITLLCFYLTTGILPGDALAQQPQQQPPTVVAADTARGIALYQEGNTEEAIRILSEVVSNRPDDADAWYYLGLSFKREGSEWSARTAFEKVVNLRPDFADALSKLAFTLILADQNEKALEMAERAMQAGDRSAESYYVIAEASLKQDAFDRALEQADQALKLKPRMLIALVTKGMAHYGLKQYDKAAECFARLLSMNPNNADAESWRAQLEHLRRASVTAKENQPPAQEREATVYAPKEVTVKARVLGKPEPQYTEEARRAGVSGTVVLRAVFSSDGRVRNFFISRWLPYGLTTCALQAAKQIRFAPASVDGQAVSQYIQIEYNFNLY